MCCAGTSIAFFRKLALFASICLKISFHFHFSGTSCQLSSLVTVVVNYVHNSAISQQEVEGLAQSVSTHYPGLKLVIGVPWSFKRDLSQYENVTIIKKYTRLVQLVLTQ